MWNASIARREAASPRSTSPLRRRLRTPPISSRRRASRLRRLRGARSLASCPMRDSLFPRMRASSRMLPRRPERPLAAPSLRRVPRRAASVRISLFWPAKLFGAIRKLVLRELASLRILPPEEKSTGTSWLRELASSRTSSRPDTLFGGSGMRRPREAASSRMLRRGPSGEKFGIERIRKFDLRWI